MAERFVKSRVQMKRGTSADWASATGFAPLEGEYIFYTDLNKTKVGKKDVHGNLTPLSDLPFLDARDADTIDGRHAAEFVLKTEAAPADAEKNVQSDWSISDSTSDAYIKNKPNVVLEGDVRLTNARTPTAHNQAATTITEDTTHRFVTDTEKTTWNAKSNFSGNYNDLTNKPTIPTVNNATLTIQKNGTNVATFTANSASNATANIVVPTKTSDLTNDSGFKTTDNNQTVKTGSVTFGANDVIEFVAGSNVSISGDAANKKITINSTDTNTETTLTVTDKTSTDTSDLVYAITNLAEGGTKGHALTPTYTGLPTKAYVDKIATGHVKYLGTVSAITGLATTAGQGDFYRVSTQFTFGSETAHVGDILLATKDNPAQNTTDWDLIHAEVDSNTWVANTVSAAGYVSAPGASNTNKVWKTDGSGVPGWRDDANTDTGATSVEVTGSGNAITAASYNATNRKITLTKGAAYATKAEVSTLISHGINDPSASITSQYYFKYS